MRVAICWNSPGTMRLLRGIGVDCVALPEGPRTQISRDQAPKHITGTPNMCMYAYTSIYIYVLIYNHDICI